VENAGEARARGVEVDGTWLPTEWLEVFGGLGFNDTEYLEFPFGECPMDRPDTDGDGDSRCDLTGEPLHRAPKWVVTLVPTARIPLAWLPLVSRVPLFASSGIDLVAGGTAEYQDVHFTVRSADPRSRQPSFFRFGVNVGLQDAARGWSLGLSVSNLTDEAVAVQTRDITLGRGSFVHILEEPRLIVGAFRWSF
jgi:outer membrane receptor protein involved in Fe transport